MSEEVIGNTGLGTGGEEQPTQADVTTEQPVVNNEVAGGQQDQMTDRERGLLRDLQAAREEAQRQKEYNEFIANSNRYNQSQQQPQSSEQFKPEPDAILYASEVEKLIEQKANDLMSKKIAELDRRRLEVDLRTKADEFRKSDANFDTRMKLASELVERDPMCQWMFDRANGAEEKIKVLERLAKEHPLYNDSYSAKSKTADEAFRRIQENASKPPTLSGIQTAGVTEKLVSQMNEKEYEEHFRKVTKGY